jgi:hypothetical protein
MDISVVKSMRVIRDAAMALQGAEVAPLVAAAVEVANAYEEALSQQSVVSIGSGPLIDADAIAAKVVERFDIIAAERVKVALPYGVPPVPWVYDSRHESVVSSDGFALFESHEVGCGDFNEHYDDCDTLEAIVEAVNAYFGGVSQPPTPAEAATDNCETQVPDIAGYPVPDYDATEIPPSAA